MTQSQLGPGREFDLIREFVRATRSHEDVALGPGDDCAVLRDGLVVSTDASIENVHFQRDWLTALEIGQRAAAVALSDVAAMGAEPLAVFAAFALPRPDYGEFAVNIMQGVRQTAERFGAVLAGGDTSRIDGPIVLVVTVIGRTGRPILRSGARPGDHVYVTGWLGGAAAAVTAWHAGATPLPAARAAYTQPVPRIREAQWLAERVDVHALIDLSDGLSSDAAHIAAASSCRITIHAPRLPVHPATARGPQPLQLALSGGDDYELCFTATPEQVMPVVGAFESEFELPITDIGDVSEGAGLAILGADGSLLTGVAGGWDHFGAGS